MNKNDVKKKNLSKSIVDYTAAAIKEMGYDNVTMEGIAKACGITKRTLYKYFPVKEAIVGRYIQMTFMNKYEERLVQLKKQESCEAMVRFYLKDIIEGVMREPVMFEHFLVYIMQQVVLSRHQNSEPSGMLLPLSVIVERGTMERVIDPQIPAMFIEDLFVFSFIELSKLYYMAPETFDVTAGVNQCTSIFLKGVGK